MEETHADIGDKVNDTIRVDGRVTHRVRPVDATSLSKRASNSSTEDIRRGMPRGTNHRTEEAIKDAGREQKPSYSRR
jgi:hypothetical protein